MAILPTMQLMNMGGGGMQQARFSQNVPQQQGGYNAPMPQGQAQPQQMDPRFEMWRRQQMQRRQAGNLPRFTQPMTMQDRMGMMGPGLASLRTQGAQAPTRQGMGGSSLVGGGAITPYDLTQRRGILPLG